jgi:DNA-binding MarR family transcriptional regulator
MIDPMDSLLGYHLRRLSVATMADLTESLTAFGLSPAAASVLFVIGSNKGITQSDVGKMLGIFRANMAPIVAALMKKGWVEREALDGRSQALRLSRAGRPVHRRAWKMIKAHEERLFGSLPPSRRVRMIEQLRALRKSVGTDEQIAGS